MKSSAARHQSLVQLLNVAALALGTYGGRVLMVSFYTAG